MTAITSNGTGGGVWSAGASWTGAAVPVEGDTVIIQNGDTITIDQTITVGADTTTAAIDVASGGKLEVLSTVAADYTLTCKGDLKTSAGGTLEIGTVANPIPAARKFEIKLNYSAALAEGKYGLINNGNMIIQGATKTVKTLLTGDLSATGTVLTIGDTTNWEASDRLAIASTSKTWSEAEDRLISTVDSGTQVTLTAGVTNTHSGTSPTQAEVINPTRNVKVTSHDLSYRGYVYCPVNSTSNVDFIEFYMIGYNATYKHGIEIRTTAADATNFAYCSVWGNAASNYSFYLYNAQNVVIDNCMIYGTDNEFYMQSVSSSIITNNVIMRSDGYGVYLYGVITGLTFEDNVITSCGNTGCYFYKAYGTMSSFDNNLIHTCNSGGIKLELSNHHILTNTTVWRNFFGGGIILLNSISITFNSLILFGNNSQNFYASDSSFIISNATLNGDSTFSTFAGFYLYNLYSICKITDSDIGTASGIKTTHSTADITICGGKFLNVILKNTKLSSATKVSNFNNAILGSYIQCEDLDQIAYNDKAWYKNGIVVRDDTIYKYGSYATRFDYQANNAEWLDYDVYIPVKNGEQIVISAWLRKNASYTDANRPKIIISGQGITEDSDQMSDVTDTWERVTVSGTPTRTGLAKLTISTYLVNAGASAWADFNKTDILSGVLNTIEGDFWANGHIAEVFMDTGSITAAEFWKTLTADVDLAGCFGKLFKDYVDASIAAIPTTAMRGTDNAALASVCTEVRLAELDAANLITDVANVKAETALIVADTNELQLNQGNWLTATGFSVPNEYDTQMGYIPSNLTDVPTAAELIAAHGSGAWTAADVSALATAIELAKVSKKVDRNFVVKL